MSKINHNPQANSDVKRSENQVQYPMKFSGDELAAFECGQLITESHHRIEFYFILGGETEGFAIADMPWPQLRATLDRFEPTRKDRKFRELGEWIEESQESLSFRNRLEGRADEIDRVNEALFRQELHRLDDRPADAVLSPEEELEIVSRSLIPKFVDDFFRSLKVKIGDLLSSRELAVLELGTLVAQLKFPLPAHHSLTKVDLAIARRSVADEKNNWQNPHNTSETLQRITPEFLDAGRNAKGGSWQTPVPWVLPHLPRRDLDPVVAGRIVKRINAICESLELEPLGEADGEKPPPGSCELQLLRETSTLRLKGDPSKTKLVTSKLAAEVIAYFIDQGERIVQIDELKRKWQSFGGSEGTEDVSIRTSIRRFSNEFLADFGFQIRSVGRNVGWQLTAIKEGQRDSSSGDAKPSR